jgi:hypothetical protein
LDERWTPLPEYMKEQILQGKNIVSIKEKTESKLARFKLKKARAMNELAMRWMNDTIAGIDSLTALYNADDALESKYKLVFLSMGQGAWSTGMSILENIPAEFELNAEEAVEYEQMAEYAGLIYSMQGAQPDSTAITGLAGIINSEQGVASMYALNTLIDMGELEYEEPIEMPQVLKSAEVTSSFTNTNSDNTNEPRMLTIMPNPAKDFILVEYELQVKGSTEIEITDLSGKPIYSLQGANLRDQVTIDTRNWKPGTYIASLKINGKTKETVKFNITD